MGCNAGKYRTSRDRDRPDHRPARLRAETPAGARALARPRHPRVQRLDRRRPRRRRRPSKPQPKSSSLRRLQRVGRAEKAPTTTGRPRPKLRRGDGPPGQGGLPRGPPHPRRAPRRAAHPDHRLHRRLRRRPGALLLAERPAARDRHRAAARRPRRAAHLRRHRAVHDDPDRLHLRGADPLDADLDLPALRLRPARLQQRRAAGRAAAPDRRADPLPGRDRLRLLRRHAGRRQLPAQLQRRPVQHPAPRPRLPTASSRRRCSPAA